VARWRSRLGLPSPQGQRPGRGVDDDSGHRCRSFL
jgi:hypothetical protein